MRRIVIRKENVAGGGLLPCGQCTAGRPVYRFWAAGNGILDIDIALVAFPADHVPRLELRCLHHYRSDSGDDGRTWCQAYETYLPNNNAGIDIARMEDGTLALVHNPIPWNWGTRTPISIALSTDNGETFTEPFPLETLDGELPYPSINADGDLLRITFTVRRQSFMYCECTIEK